MIDKKTYEKYRPTIGIECHVQLRTKTKLFSGASNDDRDQAPNTTVSPICFGLPGTLPVLNEDAVNLALRAGIALRAQIAPISSFDRKHYFYPDLPKGYQITQLERPIIGEGTVEVPFGEGAVAVRITRAHLEEDAGKLTHPEGAGYSLVDLNRAGTPLLEIVSEPDMHSPAEAKAYAQELYLLMKYAGVTNGDLFHGNMRFDVNISVAKKDDGELGTRAEIKNLNSFRSVERAAEYEFKRQVELLEKGEKIAQETRGWHDAKQKTFSQRSKENANDYRYFPDADLPPVEVSSAQIEAVRKEVEPILPAAIRQTLTAKGLSTSDITTLLTADVQSSGTAYIGLLKSIDEPALARFFANWIVNRDIVAKQRPEDERETKTGASQENLPALAQIHATYELYTKGELDSGGADTLLTKLKAEPSSSDARDLARTLGILKETDTAALEKILDDVLADPASQKALADIEAGNDRARSYLVGQVMKRSRGVANPALVSELLKKRVG